MSDQQEQNQIEFEAPQVPQVSATAENRVSTDEVSSSVSKEGAATAAKPKRTRRTTKKSEGVDGEGEAKPRARRTTRAKRTSSEPEVPITDEVAQARALAQISQAQVVRAQRRAAEREAAVLTATAEQQGDPAAPVASERDVDETPAKSSRTQRRVKTKTVDETTSAASAVESSDIDVPVAEASPAASAPAEGSDDVPAVDPALRPHRRGRKPKAFVEAEKAAAAARAAQSAAEAVATGSDSGTIEAAASKDAASGNEPDNANPSAAGGSEVTEDNRPGRGRRAAAKRSKRKVSADADASDAAPAEGENAPEKIDAPEDAQAADEGKSAKPKRKKGDKPKKADATDGAEGTDSEASSEDQGRGNRRQHKRERADERTDRKDERNDRRNRQRDRKQRNKERYNVPTEPSLSREDLQAMKVAELREKAKELELDPVGKKKAELVEEIYTTAARLEGFRDIIGILEIEKEGYGHIHAHGYMPSRDDAFVPANFIRAARLRNGDVIEGTLRPSRANDKFPGLAKIKTVNGKDPEEIRKRPKFSDLTPVYPNEPLRMEHGKDSITGRAIDIVSPIGKGQRGLIVSPPKAGKTTILKKICQSISINNPEVHLICLLVDERPEEVTDMQRSIKGEVVASTFDMPADNHTRVSELVIERAKRIVELGGDVVVVLDSITRLARAYNLAAPASGRILSGGVDSAALYPPKRFLGAARNIENGGSLTILASALVDTGSKMDEVIFEEFKGTGNMELKLDRDLADRRIFPAIDPIASGTRNEDLLVDEQMRPFVFGLRRILAGMNNTERAAASFIKGLKGTETNQEFLVRTAKKHVDYEQSY